VRETVIWLDKPEAHDYQAAEDYLSLIMSPKDAADYRQKLSDAQDNVTHRKAKDILRASQLALLAEDNKHEAADLASANPDHPRPDSARGHFLLSAYISSRRVGNWSFPGSFPSRSLIN
jgi:hypothetical protein